MKSSKKKNKEKDLIKHSNQNYYEKFYEFDQKEIFSIIKTDYFEGK